MVDGIQIFLSDLFMVLSNVDGKRILKRLEQERGVKKYGKRKNIRRTNTAIATRRD